MVRIVTALLLSTAVLVRAETDPVEKDIEAPYESDYAKGQPERQHWREVKDSFMRHKFHQILKKNGMRLNCGSCTSVFMDVSFSLDEQGKVHVKGIDRKKACGGEFPSAMQADFIAFLHAYPYPAMLRGTRVRLRLGSGLKC